MKKYVVICGECELRAYPVITRRPARIDEEKIVEMLLSQDFASDCMQRTTYEDRDQAEKMFLRVCRNLRTYYAPSFVGCVLMAEYACMEEVEEDEDGEIINSEFIDIECRALHCND